jgi:transmembrane sensor
MSSAPHMPEKLPSSEVIEAAAATWLSLRDRGMDAAETAEFVRWLQQDERHAAIFAELDRTWKDFEQLAAVPAIGAEPDADLLAPRLRPRRHRRLAWTGVAAAAAAVVLLAVFLFRSPRHTAETAIGSFQKLDLPDGSVVQLNTDTAIDTTFTSAQRDVRVVRGEVFFKVRSDAARPFIVTVGPVAVRAVGTAFNVRRHEATIEVLVTEGRVRVDDAREGHSLLASPDAVAGSSILVAGERARVPVPSPAADAAPGAATIEKVSSPEVHRALAWQERRLEFDAAPLSEIAGEFNRYNQQRLVIVDAPLAARRLSGTFRADGYDAFVRLLEDDFGVSVERRDREIVLRAPR